MKKPFILFSLILMASLFSGCHDNEKDYYDPEYAKQLSGILNFFDFKSTKDVTLDFTLEEAEAVDYKVYTENPFEIIEESGSVVLKQGLTPIAITPTNESGSYSGILTVPVNLERIFLYAYNPSKILVGEISGSAVTINKEYDIWGTAGNTGTEESSKAGNSRANITKDNFSEFNLMTLGDNGAKTWNEDEEPTNVTDTKGEVFSRTSSEAIMYRDLYNVTTQMGFTEGSTPNYDLQPDIELTDLIVDNDQNTDVKVTVVGGQTGASNILAYYCYNKDNKPDAKDIPNLPKGIIFFNAAPEQYTYPYGGEAKIFSGMTVTLKPIKADGTFGDKWEPIPGSAL